MANYINAEMDPLEDAGDDSRFATSERRIAGNSGDGKKLTPKLQKSISILESIFLKPYYDDFKPIARPDVQTILDTQILTEVETCIKTDVLALHSFSSVKEIVLNQHTLQLRIAELITVIKTTEKYKQAGYKNWGQYLDDIKHRLGITRKEAKKYLDLYIAIDCAFKLKIPFRSTPCQEKLLQLKRLYDKGWGVWNLNDGIAEAFQSMSFRGFKGYVDARIKEFPQLETSAEIVEVSPTKSSSSIPKVIEHPHIESQISSSNGSVTDISVMDVVSIDTCSHNDFEALMGVWHNIRPVMGKIYHPITVREIHNLRKAYMHKMAEDRIKYHISAPENVPYQNMTLEQLEEHIRKDINSVQASKVELAKMLYRYSCDADFLREFRRVFNVDFEEHLMELLEVNSPTTVTNYLTAGKFIHVNSMYFEESGKRFDWNISQINHFKALVDKGMQIDAAAIKVQSSSIRATKNYIKSIDSSNPEFFLDIPKSRSTELYLSIVNTLNALKTDDMITYIITPRSKEEEGFIRYAISVLNQRDELRHKGIEIEEDLLYGWKYPNGNTDTSVA